MHQYLAQLQQAQPPRGPPPGGVSPGGSQHGGSRGLMRVSASVDNLMHLGRGPQGGSVHGGQLGRHGAQGSHVHPGASQPHLQHQQPLQQHLPGVPVRGLYQGGEGAPTSHQGHPQVIAGGSASSSSTNLSGHPNAMRMGMGGAASAAISIGGRGEHASMQRQRSQPGMSPEDLVQLACSLPASFLGHPGPAQAAAMRRVDSTSSSGWRAGSMSRNPSIGRCCR